VAFRRLSFAGHQTSPALNWALIAQLALDILHCPLQYSLRPTNNILSNKLLSCNPQQSSLFVITWLIKTRQDKHVAIGCPTNTVASRQLSFAGHQHESKSHWALIAQVALDVQRTFDTIRHKIEHCPLQCSLLPTKNILRLLSCNQKPSLFVST
jgi:hypothetical protein